MTDRYEIEIDAYKQRGVVRFLGDVEGRDMVDAYSRLFSSGDWRLTYDSVWDFTGIESLDMSLEDVDSMMDTSRALTAAGQSGRVVGVVAQEDHEIMARLIRARLTRLGREAELFETMEEAEAWLDAPATASRT